MDDFDFEEIADDHLAGKISTNNALIQVLCGIGNALENIAWTLKDIDKSLEKE